MMKQLPDYIIADPTGNITVLVTSPVHEEEQAELGRQLLRLEPSGEQVGYLTPGAACNEINLRMAGGEFCGNATLSAAAFALKNAGTGEGTVTVRVSGTEKPLRVSLSSQSGVYSGQVEMPGALSVENRVMRFQGESFPLILVRFPGISHGILKGHPDFPKMERAVRQWCEETESEAFGLMFLSEDEKTLTPLVYVKELDSLYRENSCASGTCAACLGLLHERGQKEGRVSFSQPGGRLGAEVKDGRLMLQGQVSFRTP